MINDTNPCFPNVPPIYGVSEEAIDPNPSASSSQSTSFLYNLTILKDKVHQIQSLASIFMSDHTHESTAIAIPTIGTLIQEIIVTASSMMFACQQISHSAAAVAPSAADERHQHQQTTSSYMAAHYDAVEQNWYGDQTYSNNHPPPPHHPPHKTEEGADAASPYDIIELNAADLLAKFTHYCAVCGKGFKRDANLRMHMRAHGDEYKSSAALSNPMKGSAVGNAAARRKYSCPHEGCRWNKKHARFQPLKSMICVKNHYKRSHCPKMYVCKRCNRKQFSVLSDLRTHEKHCGDQKWQCSCGTTFSRKDKLMGHVALFVGHAPAANCLMKTGGNGSEVMENNRWSAAY